MFFFSLKNGPFLLQHSYVEDFEIGIVISASESEFRDRFTGIIRISKLKPL